ncbi:MAG: DUF3047 domain-containing protein [Opitutus sp.]
MGLYPAIPLALAFLATQAPASPDLFEGFGAGWSDRWVEKHLFRKQTSYEVADEGGRRVLHAVSRAAHGGMFRRIGLMAPESALLRWQWKVRQPLEANRRERERSGDDFAARVMVIFEDSIVPLRTRALAYVWAAHESMGAIYSNPFSRNVGMVVVRSGGAEAGRWLAESRDLVADYRAYFGESPRRIDAVAVLVDTDNTGLEAESWFAELSLESAAGGKP